MKILKGFITAILFLCAIATVNANTIHPGQGAMLQAPVPVGCVIPLITATGGPEWYTIYLKLTNNCGKDVDFQNSTVTFKNSRSLNTHFWGDFHPLTYPDNPLLISSQADPAGGFLASLSLHFPENPWATTTLNNKESITIIYGASDLGFDPATVNVYLSDTSPQIGEIEIVNQTAKPATIQQPYALVSLAFNGQKINTIQVPWLGKTTVANLVPGIYSINPISVIDPKDDTYEGTANPSAVTVVNNQKITSTINYKLIVIPGEIRVKNEVLPSVLTGYTGIPLVTFTRADTGGTTTEPAPWNTITSEKELDNNVPYTFSTPDIVFNNYRCKGLFSPTSLISSHANPLTTLMSYTCTPLLFAKVNIKVSGVPCGTNKVTVLFKPNDSSATVSKDVNITSGVGSDVVDLVDGVVYAVSSTIIPTYTETFNPQPLTAKTNTTENLTYIPVSH